MINHLLDAQLLWAYIIGSIPTGFLIARLCGVRDIRNHGSGNIGATNVARVLGKKFFVLIFALDVIKAYTYVQWCAAAGSSLVSLIAAGIALIIGNGFSFFLAGRGGKGAATSFGVLLALHPLLLCYVAVAWFSVIVLTKTVGAATVAALVMAPVCSWFMLDGSTALFNLALFICAWGLWRHKENIRRFYYRRMTID